MEQTIKLETYAGEDFTKVARKAKQIAESANQNVEFDFNERKCLVDSQTNLANLYRDYLNSFVMGWQTIGPVCEEYSVSIQAELANKKRLAEQKEKEQTKLYQIKEEKEKAEFEQKVKGIELELLDVDAFNEWKVKNSDAYSACVFEYAEGWARLMQAEMAKGKTLAECARETSFELGYLGITGAMYGFAVGVLAKCWKHGEALRRWHNKGYKHEGEGVVNPAVLVVNNK